MNNTTGLKPGAILRHDTYRVVRMLGQGGFGITYLATDLNLDRLVAIKEFFPKDYCDRESATSHVTLGTQSAKDFVERLKAKFLKEARNIAKFDHPGIIKIHAAFEENNTAYYVMDYIEGQSLSEMVKRHGPLSPDRAVAYIEKVGKALEYVHAHKINHLDVKPANIMVRAADDNPILIDFGLSKQYDSSGNQTSTTPTGISHGFAPMEQYNDGGVKEFSPQTDLYSLAATLYYLLSGAIPPQAIKLVEDELTFPSTIPQRLISPISKAMSPIRRNRHESVGEFVRELQGSEEVNEDTEFARKKVEPTPAPKPAPTPAPSPKPNPHAPTPAPKSGGKIYAIIGGIVVVAAVLVFALMGHKGDDPDRPSVDSLTVKVANTVKATPTVTDLYWTSKIGDTSYTGDVAIDSVTGKKIPNGKGVAEVKSGKYKGCVYDGEFVNGVMEGQTTYTLANGDVFKGTFKDNEYHQGRYTIKSSGEYFEGTFKNSAPDKGHWYDKNGNKID